MSDTLCDEVLFILPVYKHLRHIAIIFGCAKFIHLVPQAADFGAPYVCEFKSVENGAHHFISTISS